MLFTALDWALPSVVTYTWTLPAIDLLEKTMNQKLTLLCPYVQISKLFKLIGKLQFALPYPSYRCWNWWSFAFRRVICSELHLNFSCHQSLWETYKQKPTWLWTFVQILFTKFRVLLEEAKHNNTDWGIKVHVLFTFLKVLYTVMDGTSPLKTNL